MNQINDVDLMFKIKYEGSSVGELKNMKELQEGGLCGQIGARLFFVK